MTIRSQAHPEVVTIVVDSERVARRSAALRRRLAEHGCREGDRVALLCGNSEAWVAGREAATASRLVLVPVNPRLAPPEIRHVLAHSGARALMVEPALANIAERARAAVEPAPVVVSLDGAPGQHREHDEGHFGATLIYTSGTTGEPKGCMRTAEQEEARGRELIATYGITASDVHLIACPLAHSAPGIFLRAGRAAGARTVIASRFSPEGFLAAVERHRASLFFLVPTQYERMLALPRGRRERHDVSSVRAAIVAGAPISPGTKERIVDWLGPGKLWEFYGSSETGTVSVLPPEQQLERPGSVGTPPPGVEVMLDPVEDDPDVGEVYVRSSAVMSGYLDPDTGALYRPAERDGFVSVGDLGRMDADGYLYLVDRKHDTIISGGMNVYPAEVERALGRHPGVAGAVAFGLADEDWGQIVSAVVAPIADRRIDPRELRRFLREHVAGYKIPKAIAVVSPEELPVGSSGKPLRRRARERFGEALRRYDR